MKRTFFRILCLVLCLAALLPALPTRAVEERTQEPNRAKDISSLDMVEAQTGFKWTSQLFNKRHNDGVATDDSASITLTNAEGMGSVYLIFAKEYGAYTITDNASGETITCGEAEFLHEYINLSASFGTNPTSITLDFANGSVHLREIYAFSPGTPPDFVQIWEAPAEDRTDLVLFATHGDDEQLFFAGMLPYYAVEKGYQVQVVYLTNHWNTNPIRVHEMLDGLWAVGMRTYPVFGKYHDFRKFTIHEAYGTFEYYGWTKEHMLGFVVEQLRRFNPLVVVGHDFGGEYRHGQHMVYADLLAQALEISNDPTQYPELAEKYGLWDVPKAYFHMYPENEIIMDWDQPLESFGGMTAYEVTKLLGFPCHVSQQSAYGFWISFSSAAEIPDHNPRNYGLYRSTVGADVLKNDFFENLTNYAEQERQAAALREQEEEDARRREAERRAQEEAARQAEQEKLAAEQEAARLESERQQQMAMQAEQQEDNRRIMISVAISLFLVILAASGWPIWRRKRRRKNF